MQHGPALIDGSPERRTGRRDPGNDIRLTLPASAENVVLVRHVAAAHAGALGLPEQLVEDVKLAVTEACTNVVRHAYENGGPLEVVLSHSGPGTLSIVVSDRGRGLRRTAEPDTAPGLGLPLMAALSDGLEIAAGAECGSRVSLSFRRDG